MTSSPSSSDWKRKKVSEQTTILLEHINNNTPEHSAPFIREFTTHHSVKQEGGKYNNIPLVTAVIDRLKDLNSPSHFSKKDTENIIADYLLLLRVLSRDPSNAGQALEINVIGVIVRIMKKYDQSTIILPLTCTCFVNLITSPRAVVQARRKGAIKEAIKVIATHYNNEVISEACVRGLLNLCHSDENGREAAKQGIIPIIAYIARIYQDNESIQGAILGILVFLPFSLDPTTAPHLIYIGMQIKHVLDRFPDSVEIQLVGCRCLIRLFLNPSVDIEKLKEELVKGKITETIQRAITRHAHDEGVLIEAVCFLSLLSDSCPYAQIGEVEAGAIETIIKCMNENINLFKFQAEAITALCTLLDSPDLDLLLEFRERAHKANIVDTIITIMKEHPSEDVVHHNSCLLLSVLFDSYRNQEEKQQWVEKGLIEILVRAMHDHYFDSELQQAVLSIFVQLFVDKAEAQKRAKQAGAMEAIMTIIRCNRDPSLHSSFLACTALGVLCDDNIEMQKEAAERDAIEQVKILLHSRNLNADVAEAGCFAIGNVLQASLEVKIKALNEGIAQTIVHVTQLFLNQKRVISRSVPIFQSLLSCRPDVNEEMMKELDKKHKGELVYDILLSPLPILSSSSCIPKY